MRSPVGFALSIVLAAGAARAEVPVEIVERGNVRLALDGLVREWGTEFALVSERAEVVRGVDRWRGPFDASFRVALARDAEHLWLAAEVTDDRWIRSRAHRPGEDGLVLTLAVEAGGATVVRELMVFPGEPGRFAGAVRWTTGGRGDVAGAQVVEAPAGQGLSIEARIPWAAMPEVVANLTTLRARVAWSDADDPRASEPESVIATGPGSASAPGDLPRTVNARNAPAPPAAVDLLAQFRAERGIGTEAPLLDRPADLAGDARPERVVVFPGYVVVFGPGVSGGNGYLFAQLAGDGVARGSDVSLRDVTGEGKIDVVLRHRVAIGAITRELVSVYALDASGALQRVFAQEVSRVEGAARMQNELSWSAGGRVRVAFERNEGWTQARWPVGAEAGVETLLTPWSAERARTLLWNASTRAFVVERAEPNPNAPAPSATPESGGSSNQSAELPADVQSVLALFRQRENLPPDARPSHRATGDVVEDSAPEQVLVFDRTMVVVGPRFLGGRSYYAMGLPMNPGDEVLSLSVVDITGDRRGEAIVRVRRQVMTQVRGAQIPSQREMVFAYSIDAAHRGRVFAAEVARRVGDDSVVNEVRLPRGGGTEVVIEAGTARGWTAESYPFRDAGQAQFFPLLLPWDPAARRVTYRWNGSAFSRAP